MNQPRTEMTCRRCGGFSLGRTCRFCARMAPVLAIAENLAQRVRSHGHVDARDRQALAEFEEVKKQLQLVQP